jgi:hypothetical protein
MRESAGAGQVVAREAFVRGREGREGDVLGAVERGGPALLDVAGIVELARRGRDRDGQRRLGRRGRRGGGVVDRDAPAQLGQCLTP